VDLIALRWETHALPDVGDEAQDVINKQIGEYDILVGIMWKRFGTSTKKYASGTSEEFEKTYSYLKEFNKPKIMFYFRTEPFYADMRDPSHFRNVLKFQKRLESLVVLFFKYDKPSNFERLFIINLQNQIISISSKPAV
jgi:hypothetical protein